MNRLIKESSPYLLQHANDPIDWHPWGAEALAKAKEEDMAILISVGYSTCHWCHVMHRESFVNENIAAYMNKYFICIKIDKEERPDLDAIYMDACEIISGQGGWPMNLFLTPELKPFYGGTFFPADNPITDSFTWQQALNYAAFNFYKNRRSVEQEVEKIMKRIEKRNDSNIPELPPPSELSKRIYQQIIEKVDKINGGFGTGMKFPNFMALDYLLCYSAYYKNNEAYIVVQNALNAILSGGIYDHIGGGLSRYTVDSEWKIPHFEKMLYDNAQLISLLSDFIKLPQNKRYKPLLLQSCKFIIDEFLDPNGGFFSAFDADTDGIEGKYYTWKKDEIDAILIEHAAFFNSYFHVNEIGNWEQTNILFHKSDTILTKNQQKIIDHSLKKLLLVRNDRKRPALDNKIILSWNALMSFAMIKAYEATGVQQYFDIAINNINFLRNTFIDVKRKTYYRILCTGKLSGSANLRDLVFYIQALLSLYNHNAKDSELSEIKEILDDIILRFYNKEKKVFYLTSIGQKDIILAKQDNADLDMPSTNSVLIDILYKMYLLLEKEQYKNIADDLLSKNKSNMFGASLEHASMAKQWIKREQGISEIVTIGSKAALFSKQINQLFIPNKIVFHSIKSNGNHPLSKWKEAIDETLIYLCTGNTCKAPVSSVEELDL